MGGGGGAGGGGGEGARGTIRDAAAAVLDELDGGFELGGRRRGLFRTLLCLACGAGRVPRREELVPASEVSGPRRGGGGGTSSSVLGVGGDAPLSSSRDFRAYATAELAAFAAQAARERTEAAEALLVLLYDRIDGGVGRFDYALLTAALASRWSTRGAGGGGGSDVAPPADSRWWELSSLLVAEVAALWRAAASGAEGMMEGEDVGSFPAWVGDHPLLSGLASPDQSTARQATAELLALGEMVRGLAVAAVPVQTAAAVPAPEALGLITYGLILRLAGGACREQGGDLGAAETDGSSVAELARSLADAGTGYVSSASDRFGALDCLHAVMSNLLPDLIDGAPMAQPPRAGEDEFPLLSGEETVLLTDGENPENGKDAEWGGAEDAAVVAYASIGREVIAGTIAAFGSQLFSPSSSPDNLGMLCNLAAVVYRNSSALCNTFWSDWDSHCAAMAAQGSGPAQVNPDPICLLLDEAFTVASTALSNSLTPAAQDGTFVSEGIRYAEALPMVAPLLRLLASLVPANSASIDNTPSARDIFSSFLPDRTIHTILVGCACVHGDEMGSFHQASDRVRLGAVEALLALAHLLQITRQSMQEFGATIRSSLGGEVDDGRSISGPRLLHTIAFRAAMAADGREDSKDAARMVSAALDVMAELALSSSDDLQWLVQSCQCFDQSRSGTGGFVTFAKSTADEASSISILSSAMSVLDAFSSKLDRIAFSGSVAPVHVAQYITNVGNGILVACDVLVSTPLPTAEFPFQQNIVLAIMASLQNVFSSIRGIIAAHSSVDVRETAKVVLNGVINYISTSTQTGQTLAYYAALPVSVSLMVEVERFSKGQSMFSSAAMDADDDDQPTSTQKYGAWSRLVQDVGDVESAATPAQQLRSFARGIAQNIHLLPMKSSFGQSSSKIYRISHSAILVLEQWGEIVEVMTLEKHSYGSTFGNGITIEEAATIVSPMTGKAMSADLQILSPLRLLLSSPSNPLHPISSLEHSLGGIRMTNLNLLSRYLAESSDKDERYWSSLSEASSNLIALALRHSDMISDLTASQMSRPGDLTVARALGGGDQMHHALLSALRGSLGEAPADLCQMIKASRLVYLATLCVDVQPELARVMLGGRSENSHGRNIKTVRLMASAVKKVATQLGGDSGTVRLEMLQLASSCLDAFAALWKTSRSRSSGGKDALHPCDDLVADIASQTDILPDSCAILLHHKSLTHNASPDTSPTPSTHSSLNLNMLSSALEILGNEIFTSLRKGSTNDDGEIRTMLDQIAQNKTINDWSVSLTSFSALSDSAKCLSDLLKRETGSLDPSRFIALHSSPGKLGSRASLKIQKIISTIKSFSDKCGEPPSTEYLDTLIDFYYSEKKSQSQLVLIKAWSQFAQAYSTSIAESSKPSSQNLPPPVRGESPSTKSAVSERGSIVGNASGLGTAITMADCILYSLEENASLANIATSTSSFIASTSCLAGDMGSHLSSLLAHVLSDCFVLARSGTGIQVELLVDMLSRLGAVASKLFTITQPIQLLVSDQNTGSASFMGWAQKRTYCVACILRLRLLSCALVLIEMTGHELTSRPNQSQGTEQNGFNESCITFAKMASDILRELQYSPLQIEAAEIHHDFRSCFTANDSALLENTCFGYAFDVSSGSGHPVEASIQASLTFENSLGADDAALSLLQISVSTLLSIVKFGATLSQGTPQRQLRSYTYSLMSCMQESGTISSLARHFEAASRMAASLYSRKLEKSQLKPCVRMEENALDVLGSILTFFELASSCNNDIFLPSLLVEHHAVRILMNNPLFHVACRHWHSLSSSENSYTADARSLPSKNLRGYLARPEMVNDPVHLMWRSSIRTLSSLLRSFRINDNTSPANGLDAHHKQCLSGTMSFISTFNFAIFSGLATCAHFGQSKMRHGGRRGLLSPSQEPSSSLIGFTMNNLKEAADLLDLLSELCQGDQRKYFESSSPDFYAKTLSMTKSLVKSLSAFLGSTGAARETFSALERLNKSIEAGDGGFDESSMAVNATLEFNPDFSEGIPSARHAAIGNADFARSCCTPVTKQEYQLSKISTSSEKGAVAAMPNEVSTGPPEQSLQRMINNYFFAQVEEVAAECLFGSLSIIAKTHPASDSFIYFSASEASRLDAMSLVQQGMVIALRVIPESPRSMQPMEADAVDYFRVIDADYLRMTWDVVSISEGSGNTPKRVSSSMLAGMEDLNNRKCVLAYAPKPKPSSNDTILEDLSIGHLILVLNWCNQHAIDETKDCPDVSRPLVQRLAERTVALLGLEVSLHDELGKMASCSKDDVRTINAQLLQLFQDGTKSPVEGGGETTHQYQERGLRRIIEDEVWASANGQLKKHLASARSDWEAEQKQFAANNFGASEWASTNFQGQGGGSSRSPFRGNFLRSLSS